MNIKNGMSRLAIVLGIFCGMGSLLLAFLFYWDYFVDGLRNWQWAFKRRKSRLPLDGYLPEQFLEWMFLFGLPLFGFLIPWSFTHLAGWILAGFVRNSDGQAEPLVTKRPRVNILGGVWDYLIDFIHLDIDTPIFPLRVYWSLAGIYGWYLVVCLLSAFPYFFRYILQLSDGHGTWITLGLCVLMGWLGIALQFSDGPPIKNKAVAIVFFSVPGIIGIVGMFLAAIAMVCYAVLSFQNCKRPRPVVET